MLFGSSSGDRTMTETENAPARAAPASTQPRTDVVGAPGRPIRVMAFSGGGFSTSMQLGVTHALLVMRGEAPDVVAGISAGALHATVLAKVLTTGSDCPADADRMRRQVEE